jgi:hypothetical protein
LHLSFFSSFFPSWGRSDDHQRAVLNVKVRIPRHRVHRSAESVANAENAAESDEVTMDVMTSHFR